MEIKQALRTPIKRVNTLPPDPNRSLFKYQLKWTNSGIDNPKTLYSYDTPQERGLFCTGISKELRFRWRRFLDELPDDCLQFFAHCYPQQLGQPNADDMIDINIAYTGFSANIELRDSLIRIYSEIHFVPKTLKKNGLCYITMVGIPPSSTEPKPSFSPKYHRDIAIFNGLVAGKRWFINPKNQFKERGLLEVQIYDNLCYHSDNLVGIWTRNELFLV